MLHEYSIFDGKLMMRPLEIISSIGNNCEDINFEMRRKLCHEICNV